MRNVYTVLGVGAIDYAQKCVSTLIRQSGEPMQLRLITDSAQDRATYQSMVDTLPTNEHQVSVSSQSDVDEVANEKLARFPHVRALRGGHPCWRKITDPVLLAEDGEEVIVLDPDLYFPNRFRFDRVPEQGVYLMWQPPSCLLPTEAVQRVFEMGCPLAHHVDIGVAMLRAPFDWEWLDDFCRRLEPARFAGYMHIEAIIWAAYAMRVGGGHLNPQHYLCYRNKLWKRLALRVEGSHLWLLGREPFASLKCYHAGGWPKHWLARAEQAGIFPPSREIVADLPSVPYATYTPAQEQKKQLLRSLTKRVPVVRQFIQS
jgi:hypothetical protein